jgi:hypothetical protein
MFRILGAVFDREIITARRREIRLDRERGETTYGAIRVRAR